VDDSMIAIMAAIILFIIRSAKGKKQSAHKIPMEMRGHDNLGSDSADSPGINSSHQDNSYVILDWKTAATIPWGVLLLIGGGLALANGFSATGLDDLIAGNLAFLEGVNYIIIILVLWPLRYLQAK
jgi:solute carrier family 13 (sodium-dependent dicarboxylate transporter), member 2/3/5